MLLEQWIGEVREAAAEAGEEILDEAAEEPIGAPAEEIADDIADEIEEAEAEHAEEYHDEHERPRTMASLALSGLIIFLIGAGIALWIAPIDTSTLTSGVLPTYLPSPSANCCSSPRKSFRPFWPSMPMRSRSWPGRSPSG